MSIAGNWKLSMNTPFGVQTPTLKLAEESGQWQGCLEGANGEAELEEIEVEGSNVKFKSNIATPMGKFKVSFRGAVDGDEIEGTYKSMAGVNEFSGTRE